MKRSCTVSINGESFSAQAGEKLLNAALRRGLNLAYDCREGRCGTCTVELESGKVLGGETAQPGHVRACQAHILTDLKVRSEVASEVSRMNGHVSLLKQLTRDVIEVGLALNGEMQFKPGQYLNVVFDGLPVRSFSPSAPLAEVDVADAGTLRFHIRQLPDGAVSSELGKGIVRGSPVEVEGPYGVACLEPGLSNRLILVSGGTGFAPIWAIAYAAITERPARDIVFVTGVRQTADLYMADALQWAAQYENVALTVAVDEGPVPPRGIFVGRPTEYLPKLEATDIIHVAGPPALVEAVSAAGRECGCTVHADAFTHATNDTAVQLLLKMFGRAA